MALIAVDSLSLKIKSFLKNVGAEYNDQGCSQTQLLRYFEDEYGLEVMPLLEQEWVNEQVDRDLETGYFKTLRLQISEDRRDRFDEDIASFWGA